MNGQQWTLLVVFTAMLAGISFASPEAAVLVGGFVAIALLVKSGVLDQLKERIAQ